MVFFVLFFSFIIFTLQVKNPFFYQLSVYLPKTPGSSAAADCICTWADSAK